MAFDWNEYLSLAKAIVDITTLPNDARLPTAISRAYYAAFHISLAFYETKSVPFDPNRSKHESVVFLLKHGNLDQQRLGDWLDKLRIDRNKADYDSVIPGNLAKLAQASFKRAQDIIDGIGKLK